MRLVPRLNYQLHWIMRTFAYFLLLLALFLPEITSAQGGDGKPAAIQLRNASFEDMPRNSMPPIGWTDCGWATETAPDVQPDPMHQFQVTMRAQEGSTYLGMVVRDNDTWERVGQELNEPMVGGQCYEFHIQLARSKVYLSQSRVDNRPANYVTPTQLRIWGGYDLCDRVAIIGNTELVSNFNWKDYNLKLSPGEDFTHLVFEVFYQTPNLIPYNGNLLLDNASALIPMECDETVPERNDPFLGPSFAQQPTPPGKQSPNLTPAGGTNVKSPEPPKPPAVQTYKLGNTEGKLAINTIFQIEAITFKGNSYEVEPSSIPALEEIVKFMNSNPGVTIEIGGHASSQAGDKYAMDISLARARSVVEYLKKEGIKERRLEYYGYGKSRRLCMEETEACRRRNQRVEVKIKSLKPVEVSD